MHKDNRNDDYAIRRMKEKKVTTVAELAGTLKSSGKTVRRRLKSWRAYTSFNKNGRYYTLPDIPVFDSNGLWDCKGIHFSRHGNLKQTIVYLVNHSEAGLDAAELAAVTGIYVRSFLTCLRDVPDLRREKIQGRFIYFATEERAYTEQKKARCLTARVTQLPSDTEAVAILAEAVRNPNLSVGKLSSNLKKQKYHISDQKIYNLFAYHGLAIKKMPDSIS